MADQQDRQTAVVDRRVALGFVKVQEVGAVDLLERRPVGLLGRHVGGQRQKGRAVGQRAGHRHHQVGGAGTA